MSPDIVSPEPATPTSPAAAAATEPPGPPHADAPPRAPEAPEHPEEGAAAGDGAGEAGAAPETAGAAGVPDAVAASDAVATPDAGVVHTLTGDVRRHDGFRSRYLPSLHDVWVFLPPGYDAAPERRYPVLYLHDGQNLFDDATAFSREWQVDETAQRLIEEGAIEPLVIVGVSNAGPARIEEYTPTRDRKHRAGGGATRYGRMLVEELKPFIDATYRTRPEPQHTGLGGSSLGGLLSMYLGLQYTALFWRLAVLSPSVWWDDRFILRRARLLGHKSPARIWLSAGTAEGEGVVEGAAALRDVLLEKGWREGEDLAFHVIEGGRHDEATWAAEMEAVLRFLYPREDAV